MNNKSRGFTLIELLVVIAIIGLLASIVLVSLNSTRTKARDSKAKGDLHQIALASEMYYDSQAAPAYPAVMADTDCSNGGTAITAGKSIGAFLNPVPWNNGDSSAGIYSWCNPGSTARFCAYVESDVTTGSYFYVSEKGTGTAAAAGSVCP